MIAKNGETMAGKRVGIWIRVSTEDQAKGESPQHHEARARAYAESKGWRVADVYHLEGVSGKSVIGHAEARRMMKDVERGHITGLIFSKLARLGRNTRELLEFSEFFQKHDADLICLQESIDTSTPAGRLFYTIFAALAHWEREEIASRVAASVPIRAKLGKSLGGPAPFGYQWKDGKLMPHADEAPVRRLVHELFVRHKRIRTVARLLNKAGHRTRKGKPFAPNTIEKYLRDSTPKGLHRANYMNHDTQGKGWKLKPESDWVYQEVEPILDAETWDACAAILRERDEGRKPVAKPTVQLFSGLLYCACGRKMYVPSNTPKYVCAKCRTKIEVADLEEHFIAQLRGYMLSRGELNKYLEAKNQDLQNRLELLETLRREEKNLRSEMDKVYQLYVADQITPQGFGERHKPMEARLSELREEIPKTEAAVDFLKINLLSADEILNEAGRLSHFWPNMTPQGKRRVVEAVVERLTYDGDELTIALSYLPVPPSSPVEDSRTEKDADDSSSNDNEEDNGDDNNEDDANGNPNPATSTTAKADAFAENMAKRRTAVRGSDGASLFPRVPYRRGDVAFRPGLAVPHIIKRDDFSVGALERSGITQVAVAAVVAQDEFLAP